MTNRPDTVALNNLKRKHDYCSFNHKQLNKKL